MRELHQRLKELDAHTFEQFCFSLLREMYPGVNIRHVQGAAGDEGVDLFSGELENACVVWQCKSFPDGVGKSQKEKIKDSLRRAIDSVKAAEWILCLSVDLDIKTHRWWLRLRESYSSQVKMELVAASDLVHQLIFRRTLREAFFPQAIMDIAGLRATLSQSNYLSTDELSALCADNIDQYTDRLIECDPRFTYEMRFRANTGPVTETAPPGALLSVHDDQKTIDVFPRDLDSLQRKPPAANFTLQGASAKRFIEHIDTGKPLETSPGDLIAFSSDFDFLLPSDIGPVTEWRLKIQQSFEKLPKYLFRLTFGQGDEAVIYDLVKFQTVCIGKKAVELKSTTKLPFAITLNMDLTGNGRGIVHYSEDLSACSTNEVAHAVAALTAMIKTGVLDLYNLEAGKRFMRVECVVVTPEWLTRLDSIVSVALRVEAFYGINLTWPASLDNADLDNVHRLHELISGVIIPLNNMTVEVTKTVQFPKAVVNKFLKSQTFDLNYFNQNPIQLFGTSVIPGPMKVNISGGRVLNHVEYAAFLHRAPIGKSIILQIACPMGAVMTSMPRSVPSRE